MLTAEEGGTHKPSGTSAFLHDRRRLVSVVLTTFIGQGGGERTPYSKYEREYTHLHLHLHLHLHTHTPLLTHPYLHTLNYIYTHTHLHTHTQRHTHTLSLYFLLLTLLQPPVSAAGAARKPLLGGDSGHLWAGVVLSLFGIEKLCRVSVLTLGLKSLGSWAAA